LVFAKWVLEQTLPRKDNGAFNHILQLVVFPGPGMHMNRHLCPEESFDSLSHSVTKYLDEMRDQAGMSSPARSIAAKRSGTFSDYNTITSEIEPRAIPPSCRDSDWSPRPPTSTFVGSTASSHPRTPVLCGTSNNVGCHAGWMSPHYILPLNLVAFVCHFGTAAIAASSQSPVNAPFLHCLIIRVQRSSGIPRTSVSKARHSVHVSCGSPVSLIPFLCGLPLR